MNSPIAYSRRGGAVVGSRFASWPFGKIEISGESVTLGVAEVLRIQPLGFIASEQGPGVRIFFRGEYCEEFVDFYSISGWREAFAELRYAGFNVVEPLAR